MSSDARLLASRGRRARRALGGGGDDLDGAQVGGRARGVGVHGEHDAPGKALQQGRLTVRQGRTHAGNHVAIAVLVGGDHVHVPFDDYCGALLADVLPGPVQAVEHAAFIKNRRLRCV